MDSYKRHRRSSIARTFSLYEELPAHFRLCLFNIFFILLIFALMSIIELILDIKIFQNTDISKIKFLTWLIPLCCASICIFMFTLFTVIYFAECYLFKSTKFWFQFGTVLIYMGLLFLGLLVPIMPWYFVSFWLSYDAFSYIYKYAPVLFYQMCGYVILSIFVIGFVTWVVGWIIIQKILVATGLRKKISEVQFPMKIVNDDRRISVSNSTHNVTPSKNMMTIETTDIDLESSFV